MSTGLSGSIRRSPIAAEVLRADFTQVFNAAVRERRLSHRAWVLLVACGPRRRNAIRGAGTAQQGMTSGTVQAGLAGVAR